MVGTADRSWVIMGLMIYCLRKCFVNVFALLKWGCKHYLFCQHWHFNSDIDFVIGLIALWTGHIWNALKMIQLFKCKCVNQCLKMNRASALPNPFALSTRLVLNKLTFAHLRMDSILHAVLFLLNCVKMTSQKTRCIFIL